MNSQGKITLKKQVLLDNDVFIYKGYLVNP